MISVTGRICASKTAAILVGFVILGLIAAPALAHVPAWGTANDSPENANVVTNPTKSWAFYDRVDAGGSAYYEATYLEDERLYLTLYTPDPDLQPGLVLMTPGGETSEQVPDAVEVPADYGATVLASEPAESAEFEPFTPGAYYYTLSLDRTVETGGTYLFAVYDVAGESGPVGVAVGRSESFTLIEFLTVPIDVLGVHAWEGDSPLLVFGPGLLVAVLGVVRLRGRLDGRSGREPRIARWALGLAAVAIFATSAMMATQFAVALAMTGPSPAAVLTLLLVVVPATIATWLGRLATDEEIRLSRRLRVMLFLAGAGSLATWGGLLLAPLVPIGLSLLPGRLLR
ncbi:MAG: hypothetical protein V5A43_09235 [Haloarculaceae archaeon]